MRCCPGCGAVFREEISRCTNDGSELIDTDTDPLIGTKVGTYKVDAFLGQGGMGRVYRAHHMLLAHRICALKVLLGDLAGNAAMRIRFSTEAKHASRLAHPNIASVFDFGRTESGLLYLAMEYVEGSSLEKLITNVPIEPARVIRLARALCDGLAHAHDVGVIHRDFKPDNVLVMRAPDGEEVPKIVDFGLAIAADHSDSRVTSTGLVMGTAAYIAPEQLIDGAVDHRVDLYALGVTMFELLTGGLLPFAGESTEVIGRKVASDPPSLASRAKHPLPAGLVAVVDRLLQRNPERRFADARELAAALDELSVEPTVVPERLRAARIDDTVLERRANETSVRLSTQPVRAPRRRWPIILAIAGVGGTAIAAAVVVSRDSRSSEVVASVTAPAEPKPMPDPVPVATAPDRRSPIPLEHAQTAAVDESEPARPTSVRTSIAPLRRGKRKVPPVAAVAAVAVDPARVSAPASPPPAIPVLPAPPASLTVSLDGLAVDGALSRAMVLRALDRVMPAIRSCTANPGVVDVRFAIGESRRAMRTNASGISAGVAGCVAGAIGTVRTETAPDVGDVEVRVRVAFARRG